MDENDDDEEGTVTSVVVVITRGEIVAAAVTRFLVSLTIVSGQNLPMPMWMQDCRSVDDRDEAERGGCEIEELVEIVELVGGRDRVADGGRVVG